MSAKFKPGTVYFCAELDVQDKTLHDIILVMPVATDLVDSWKEGITLSVYYDSYILTERQVDKRSDMVTYKLKKLAPPPPVNLT